MLIFNRALEAKIVNYKELQNNMFQK